MASAKVGEELLRCGVVEIFREVERQTDELPLKFSATRGINLFLLTDKVSRHCPKSAFVRRAKLIVVTHLFADHQLSAFVVRVEPLGIRDRTAMGAIEADAGPQLDEWTSLWHFGGLLELNANPRSALSVLLRAD